MSSACKSARARVPYGRVATEGLATRIRRLREEAGISSDRELCRMAGLSESTLSTMLATERRGDPLDPTISTCIAFAGALRVSLDLLVLGYERRSDTAKQRALTSARDMGFDARALERVGQMPDDPALGEDVWMLRLQTAQAEVQAQDAARQPVRS